MPLLSKMHIPAQKVYHNYFDILIQKILLFLLLIKSLSNIKVIQILKLYQKSLFYCLSKPEGNIIYWYNAIPLYLYLLPP